MPLRPVSRAAARLQTQPSTLKHYLVPLPNAPRLFSNAAQCLKKPDTLPPRPTLDDATLTKKYLKGSGPGGQKINKTASAVQMTHLPTGIVIKSQATRSRSQNETIARRLLAEKVELLEKGADSRVAIKRERVSKRKRSAEKKSRRKYRKLAESAGRGSVEDAEEVDEDEDEQVDREEMDTKEAQDSPRGRGTVQKSG